MDREQNFFDFAAAVGLTKHFGGNRATLELAKLCHVDRDSTVLDVGCGAGTTPCFLARQIGCRVIGVDVLPAMVERSIERAQREGLAGRVEFRVADAQDLPFEDGTFDAVLTESATAFPPDKEAAVGEYARVTRPGGYVGLAEATWLKVPPPPELVAWVSQDVGACVKPLAADGWVELLRGAGLGEVVSRTYPVDPRVETRELVRRYGCRNMLGILLRGLALYARNPAYRRFVRDVQQGGIVPADLGEYFGYGMYVGRKAEPNTAPGDGA
jgi:arsenite methyltransferase